MNQLDWYLARTVGTTMLLAVLGLVGMLTLFTFLEQIEDLRNSYTVWTMGQFVLLSMPRMFYETIPYAALIGCLAGLGLLANNSELVVMRAAGVSTWSIAGSALKPALVLVIIGLMVGEYVLPDAERMARVGREKSMSAEDGITPKFGFWYREGQIYMHFDEVGQSGFLEGVTHYHFDKNRELVRTVHAERAVFHDMGGKENYWLLEKVIDTEIAGELTDTKYIANRQWQSSLTPELLSTEILVQPDKMSISELNKKIAYMREQGLNSGKFELGFWGKVFQPLSTIGLVFVAISFVFGPLREATMGMRVVSGLIIGIAFKFVLDLLSPASLVFGFPPVIAILTPISVCFVIGYILVRRAS